MLGDYTCSEIELTDDDEPSTKKQKAKKVKSDNSKNSAKAKTYNCSECTKSVLIRMRRYLGCAGIYEKKRMQCNKGAKNMIRYEAFSACAKRGVRISR